MEETDQQQNGEPTRGLHNESRKECTNSNPREDDSEKTANHRAEEESTELTKNCNKRPEDDSEMHHKASELTASQSAEERSEEVANHENRLEDSKEQCAELPKTIDGSEVARRQSHRVTTYVTVPPDGGWGWVIVFASFMCSFVVDGIVFSFGVFLNEMSRDLGASKSEVTIAGALLSGFYLIAGPFVSAIANRYGFRLTGIVGSIIGSLAFVAASMAQNIETLWLVYGFIGGIGFGMIYVPSVITTGFYFEKWRALATGISVTGSGVGTILVAPLTTLLIERFTWRGALLLQAGAVLNCAVFSSLYRPLKPVQVSVTGDPEEGSEDEDKPKMPLLHRIKMARDELKKADSTLSIENDVEIIAVPPLETNKFLKANNNVYYPTAAEALKGQSLGDEDIGSSFDSLNKKKIMNRSNGFFKRNTIDNGTIIYSEKRPSLVYSKRINRTRIEDEYDPVKDFRAEEALLTEHIHDDVLYVPKKQKHAAVGDRRDSFTVRYRSRSQSDSSTKSARSRRNTLTSKMEAGVRPFYRDDIFFQASLHRLPQYQSHGSGLDYTMSVSRLPTWKDVQEEEEASCQMFPEAVRRTLATMLDTSLLGSPSFMLLAIAGFTFTLGLFTPFMFLPDRALLNGMDPGLTMFLLSSIGVTNTLGRILSGVITSLPGVSSLALNNIALTVGGLATILSGLSNTPLYQFSFTAIFGLAISFFVSLRSIIVVELIGLEKLTNAFGLLLLFQGLAAAVGSPIAGPFVSAIANRYGFRLTGIVGSIIGSLAFVAASMAQNIETLWLVYGFIGGIGFGMIYVPSVITTGFYFEKWRALATGISVTGSGVGTILVAPLTTLLIERFTWRGALLLQAGAVLNCAVFSSLYRPLKPVQVSVTGDPEEGSEDEDKPKMPLLHRIKMARDELKKADSTLSIENDVEIIAVPPLETNKFLKANNNVYYPTAAEALKGQSLGDEDIGSSFDSLNKKKIMNRSNGFFKRNTIDNGTIIYSEKRPSLVYSKRINRTRIEDEYDPVKDFRAEEALLTEHIHDDVLYVPKKQKHAAVGDRRDSFTVRYRSRSQSDSSTKSARSRRNTLTSKMEAGVRPFYRDDIFFQASLHRLPQYQSHGSGLDYTMSVSRLPTWKDVQEEEEASCQMFPEAVRRTLATMLDTSLLGSPSFMLLAIAGFTFTLGLFTPFMFLPDRALLNGMDPGLTMFLLSSIGVTNTLGRILSGVITSLPGVSSLALNNIALTVGGLATILSGLSNTPLYQFSFTAIFGLAISFFVSLRSIIVVELIGLEKLTNAFGLLLLFQGLAAAVGSPIAGVVMDATGNYDIPFYISGGLILLSGVMCYPLGCLKAWEDRRNQRHKEQIV